MGCWPVTIALSTCPTRSSPSSDGSLNLTALTNVLGFPEIVTSSARRRSSSGDQPSSPSQATLSATLIVWSVKHVRRPQRLRSALRKGAASVVPLADRAIGNLQQWLIGTYHGVSKPQLQVYLDEFVFRHNRRKTPAAAFQTLLGLGTAQKSTQYERIRGAKDLQPQDIGPC